jgi:hypothetical protein
MTRLDFGGCGFCPSACVANVIFRLMSGWSLDSALRAFGRNETVKRSVKLNAQLGRHFLECVGNSGAFVFFERLGGFLDVTRVFEHLQCELRKRGVHDDNRFAAVIGDDDRFVAGAVDCVRPVLAGVGGGNSVHVYIVQNARKHVKRLSHAVEAGFCWSAVILAHRRLAGIVVKLRKHTHL